MHCKGRCLIQLQRRNVSKWSGVEKSDHQAIISKDINVIMGHWLEEYLKA